MRTEKVETIVQTIRDTLLCALQLYRDEKGIQGPDVDLHRRLIQQVSYIKSIKSMKMFCFNYSYIFFTFTDYGCLLCSS